MMSETRNAKLSEATKSEVKEQKEAIIKASTLYDKAHNGPSGTQFEVGVKFYNIKSEKLAFDFFKKAAKRGNAKSMNRLGEMYFHGKGCIRSLSRAKSWWERSAELGNQKAQNNLKSMPIE
ncbi:MAG: tetratricopeptide repeat protein [Desulfuromonadales bacterium]|nr:tetratricopeptide repeat protein [Desulfuromonadales bacterium]MDT8422200.1 tetratricopeptide repeat protein [Desulfuromonadales bacterium]